MEGARPDRPLRERLVRAGVADDAFFAEIEEEAGAFAARLRAGVIASKPRPVEEMFAWVFAELPEHLRRQREEVLGD